MATASEPVEFTIDGDPAHSNQVSLGDFAEMVADWFGVLHQVTVDLSGRKPAVEWVVRDLRTSSAVLSCEPHSQTDEGDLVAKESIRLIVVATNSIGRGGDPTRIISEKASIPLLRLVQRVEEGQVPGASIKSGQLVANIRPSGGESVQIRTQARRAVGSVEGILTGISFAGARPSFVVRDHLTGNLVPCYFDADRLYDLVISGLRNRVAVSGIVTERSNGETVSVTDVEEIYLFPARSGLPQPSDMLEIDPYLAEGLPAEEWVGKRRG